jgi:hypothetical protein
MADTNDSFKKEIEEELRREQMAALWNKYGTYLIAAVAAVVFAIAGYKFWQSSQLTAAQKAGASYSEAVELAKQGKADEALKAFEALSESAPGGYAGLTQLQIAGAQRQAGKVEEAIKTYEQVSSASSVDTVLRDYATLQIAALQVGKADFTTIKNRLNDLLADDNAYRYSARELVGLAAFQAGNMTEARTAYDQLAGDVSTPPGLLQRTRMMLARISATEIAKDTPSAVVKSETNTPAKPETAAEPTKDAEKPAEEKK